MVVPRRKTADACDIGQLRPLLEGQRPAEVVRCGGLIKLVRDDWGRLAPLEALISAKKVSACWCTRRKGLVCPGRGLAAVGESAKSALHRASAGFPMRGMEETAILCTHPAALPTRGVTDRRPSVRFCSIRLRLGCVRSRMNAEP